MPQSLANVLVHIIFSTKNRYPFLADKDIRNKMHAYLGGTSKNLGCSIIAVGGVADHVHILCTLPRDKSISEIIREIKRSSSKWVKAQGNILTKFAWQNGYGIFSVGKSEVERTKKYILNQEEHHRKKGFQNEFREFLKKYKIEYDERYVWD